MDNQWYVVADDDKKKDPLDLFLAARDLPTQATISVVLGIFAFLAFCVSITMAENLRET